MANASKKKRKRKRNERKMVSGTNGKSLLTSSSRILDSIERTCLSTSFFVRNMMKYYLVQNSHQIENQQKKKIQYNFPQTIFLFFSRNIWIIIKWFSERFPSIPLFRSPKRDCFFFCCFFAYFTSPFPQFVSSKCVLQICLATLLK